MEYKFNDINLIRNGHLFLDYIKPLYDMSFYNYMCFRESLNKIKNNKTSIHSINIK